MFKSQKSTFWEALLVTILIFALGVIAGFVLENWRTSNVNNLYQISEVSLLDARVQSEIYSLENFNCTSAISENINFANRVYLEAKQLERYQKASVLTDDLRIAHEKYDLLRTMLLLNSLKIKQKCNVSYSDVVYFYKYNDKDKDLIAREEIYSRLLSDLKETKGDSILLIPIAVDNNVSSVKLLLAKYNISTKELPVILIDEKVKINTLQNSEQLAAYFD